MENIIESVYTVISSTTPYIVSMNKKSIFIHFNTFIKIEISNIVKSPWHLHINFPFMIISKVFYIVHKKKIDELIDNTIYTINREFHAEVSILSLSSLNYAPTIYFTYRNYRSPFLAKK